MNHSQMNSSLDDHEPSTDEYCSPFDELPVMNRPLMKRPHEGYFCTVAYSDDALKKFPATNFALQVARSSEVLEIFSDTLKSIE